MGIVTLPPIPEGWWHKDQYRGILSRNLPTDLVDAAMNRAYEVFDPEWRQSNLSHPAIAAITLPGTSFNLHDEFFAKHQLNYLVDIVRVLVHTGQKFNFYDVLVMAIDEQVLREQVEKARHRLEHDPSIPVQRRLNFEMSVKNLYQSFGDRERVPKI